MATVLDRPAARGAAFARITADQFAGAIAAGVYDYRRVELLNGYVVEMGGPHIPHAWAKDNLLFALRAALLGAGSKLAANSDVALRVSQWDEPVPDLLVWDAIRASGPVPLARARIVIEIADTSLEKDLGPKAELYAAAMIGEYWVVDLDGGRIYQFWAPAGGLYRKDREIAFGDTILAETLADIAIDTVTLG